MLEIKNAEVYDLEESWADIIGYEGLYKISSMGRVMSLHYKKSNKETDVILKPIKERGGYLTVILSKNTVHKRFKIHRLVAKSFIPNPNNYPIVNHKDENPQNNNVNNLEWCTAAYNTNYGNSRLKRSISRGRRVAQLDNEGNVIRIFPSGRCAANSFGLANTNLFSVLSGKQKSFGGYKWRYID